MVEVGFAVLVAAIVVAIAVAVRSATTTRSAKVDPRLVTADDSGVALTRLSDPALSAPRGLAKFDVWFDTAVRRSGLDASPAGVVAVMLLLAVVLGGGLYMWKETFGLAALGVVFGLGIPLGVIAYTNRRYRWRMQAQLPDAYRMLAGSVRAGQTLEQSIDYYANHGVEPLAEQFAHCSALMRLGMSPAGALQATAGRVRLLDFDLLVSTVGLYMQTGGNLVLLLERLADSVRDRNQFAGQFFAATAQSRIVAIAIGITAPLILIYYALAEPEHVQTFFASNTGWMILAGCAVMEVIGVVWLWNILSIDY